MTTAVIRSRATSMMSVTTTVSTIAVTRTVTTSTKARVKAAMMTTVMVMAKKVIATETAQVNEVATMKLSGYMLLRTL